MKHIPYVGTVGFLIEAETGMDISAATDAYFLVRKPSGLETTWAASLATIDGETRYLRYATKTGDLNEPGIYRIHAHFTLGAWSGPGHVGNLEVKALFS